MRTENESQSAPFISNDVRIGANAYYESEISSIHHVQRHSSVYPNLDFLEDLDVSLLPEQEGFKMKMREAQDSKMWIRRQTEVARQHLRQQLARKNGFEKDLNTYGMEITMNRAQNARFDRNTSDMECHIYANLPKYNI